jgi:hypothetical protein
MRILDIVLNEAEKKIYAIGDSHAVAIAQSGGFINLATNGRSAFSSDNDGAVGKVPAGSTVVLSAGANDMLNSNKAGVVSRVQGLIDELKKKKCKVYYVLFAETDNPKFAKDRNMLRNQMSAGVGSDASIIDMGSLQYDPKTKKDGIHAPMSWYAGAAKKVSAGAAATPAPQATPVTSTKTGQGEKADSGVDIKDLIGNYFKGGGAAGTAAILSGNGIINKIRNAIGGNSDNKNSTTPTADKSTPTADKSTPTADKSTPAPGNTKIYTLPDGRVDTRKTKWVSSKQQVSPKVLADHLFGRGLDKNSVLGMIANAQGESSFMPGVWIASDAGKGQGGGLFGFHDPVNGRGEFTNMVNYCGKGWQTNWQGQLDYAIRASGIPKTGFKSSAAAAEWFVVNYERPKYPKEAIKRRVAFANNLAKTITA